MSQLVEKLIEFVQSPAFLSSVSRDGDDIDGLLDARDSPEFETAWNRVYDEIQRQGLESDSQVDLLREKAFKTTYALTEHPEFCGYVSDDFGLLGDTLLAGMTDGWATALFRWYASGSFPVGDLEPVEKTLEDELSGFDA